MSDRIERYPNCSILCHGWKEGRGEKRENMTVEEAITYAIANNYNCINFRTKRNPNTSTKYFYRRSYAYCKGLVERARIDPDGVMTILIRPV